MNALLINRNGGVIHIVALPRTFVFVKERSILNGIHQSIAAIRLCKESCFRAAAKKLRIAC